MVVPDEKHILSVRFMMRILDLETWNVECTCGEFQVVSIDWSSERMIMSMADEKHHVVLKRGGGWELREVDASRQRLEIVSEG